MSRNKKNDEKSRGRHAMPEENNKKNNDKQVKQKQPNMRIKKQEPVKAKKKVKTVRKVKRVVVTILLLAIILAGTLFGYKIYQNGGGLTGALATILGEDTEKLQNLEPIQVLIMGESGVDDYKLADTIMVASYNPKTQKASLMSIPRDTYVSVAGHGKTKINHAYAYGKEQLALKTINSNFGLNISEYVTINFKGLINVINKIGGIELNISKAEKDYINEFVHESYELTKKPVQLLSSYGKVKLTGEQALTHSRNRTIGNDFTREERQRDVLTAVMNKVSTMSITQLWSLSDSVLSEVKTNLNVSECMGIASDVLGNTSSYLNNIVSKQIPSEDDGGKGDNINGIYYYVCDLQKASKSMKNIIYGE